MNGPCKDCERRKMGCHGRCKEYQEFAKRLEEIRKKRSEETANSWPWSRRGEQMIWQHKKNKRK